MASAFRLLWLLPVLSACFWLATLLGLFLCWIRDGQPHYPSMRDGQYIAYISDLGAEYLKPLFIAGCCLTTVFLDLSFIADRFLRHRGVLAANTSVVEKVLSGIAILAAIAGTVGLICLSIFDTLRFHRLHDTFLALFIAGYIVCAICLCAEFQRLGRKYRQHRVLRASFWIKLAFVLVEVALAIVFGVFNLYGNKNVAAATEWVIALIFTFWVLSFVIDLWPAMRSGRDSHHQHQAKAGLHHDLEDDPAHTSNGIGSTERHPTPIHGEFTRGYHRDAPANPANNF